MRGVAAVVNITAFLPRQQHGRIFSAVRVWEGFPGHARYLVVRMKVRAALIIRPIIEISEKFYLNFCYIITNYPYEIDAPRPRAVCKMHAYT